MLLKQKKKKTRHISAYPATPLLVLIFISSYNFSLPLNYLHQLLIIGGANATMNEYNQTVSLLVFLCNVYFSSILLRLKLVLIS